MPRHLLLCLAATAALAAQPETRLLWPSGAPGALGNEDADKPSLTIYLPSGQNGVTSAVVVCPGGGYQMLAMDHEGKQIAEWLNARGVAAFVLKYRLGPRYHYPAQLQDAQRALRTVRSQAAAFHVDPGRIGIWGFSAGGHLASTAATHFDDGDPNSADPIERAGSRPGFAILAYPVITMKLDHTHKGSRRNLLGDNPSPELIEKLSNQDQVTARTPPTFLFATDDDPAVPVENSLMFFQALHKAGVPAELHIYQHGLHGVGLDLKGPVLGTWPELLNNWLRLRGLLGGNE